jgi:hypothetical protein
MPFMTEADAAQEALLEIANELESIYARLVSLRAMVPPTPMELDPAIEPDVMDRPTAVRSVIGCVLHDRLSPAIRDLRAAAVSPAKSDELGHGGESEGDGSRPGDDDTWDEST